MRQLARRLGQMVGLHRASHQIELGRALDRGSSELGELLPVATALAAALPSLSEQEVEWRFQCVVAILRSCVATRQRMEPESVIDAEGLQRMMDTIMPFLRGGLDAPPQGRDPQIK